MTEKKIKVPEGMLKAAVAEWYVATGERDFCIRMILEAALRWLSENPIVPDDEQCLQLWRGSAGADTTADCTRNTVSNWQRRMFLAPPESEMIGAETLEHFCSRFQTIGEAVSEAFRIGQDSGEAKALKNGVKASK